MSALRSERDAADPVARRFGLCRPYQRQGIGKRLIAAVAERLRPQGYRSLVLWVLDKNPARSFYERLGDKLLGEKPWCNNAEFGLDVREVAYGWTDINSLVGPLAHRGMCQARSTWR